MPQFFLPSQKCTSLINNYVILKSDSNVELLEDKYIPDGSAAIVFNFNAQNKFINENPKSQLPDYFIVIPNMLSIKFQSQSIFDTLVVKCKASVLSKILKIDFSEISDYAHIKANIFDGFPMYEILYDLESTEERINLFEEYLFKRFSLDKYIPDEIDNIYESIVNSGYNICLKELMTSRKINQRSFSRKFLKRVGLSSKELLRIVRVNHVWNLCRKSDKIDFLNVVYECGFFDQAHFINDFKKIIGETPRNFFKRELSQVECISGRQARIFS